VSGCVKRTAARRVEEGAQVLSGHTGRHSPPQERISRDWSGVSASRFRTAEETSADFRGQDVARRYAGKERQLVVAQLLQLDDRFLNARVKTLMPMSA